MPVDRPLQHRSIDRRGLRVRWAGAAVIGFVALYFADEVLLRLYDDVGLSPRQLGRFAIYSALSLALLLNLRWSRGVGSVVCGYLSLAQAIGLCIAVSGDFIAYRMHSEVHVALWSLRLLAILSAFLLLLLPVSTSPRQPAAQ